MWNLCVVSMKLINRVIFPFTHIRCKWLTVIIIRLLIVRSSILLDELLDEGIRAGGVIWRIGEFNDVLIRADREALYITDLVEVLLGQFSLLHSFNSPYALRRYAACFRPCLSCMKR